MNEDYALTQSAALPSRFTPNPVQMKLCFGFGNSLGIPKAIFAGVRLKIAAKLTAIFAVARFGKRFDIPDRFSRPKRSPGVFANPYATAARSSVGPDNKRKSTKRDRERCRRATRALALAPIETFVSWRARTNDWLTITSLRLGQERHTSRHGLSDTSRRHSGKWTSPSSFGRRTPSIVRLAAQSKCLASSDKSCAGCTATKPQRTRSIAKPKGCVPTTTSSRSLRAKIDCAHQHSPRAPGA
jgi:hypothetical protein